MFNDQSYRKSFFIACVFHLSLALLLLIDGTTQRSVLTAEKQNEAGRLLPIEQTEQLKPQAVKAVAVNTEEVMAAVNHLKQQRDQQLKAEQQRQALLKQQAETARKERLAEQQYLVKLKQEAEKLALAKKKQIEEEKQRLKQLALEKAQEEKKLTELKQKQLEEKAKLNKVNEQRLKEELLHQAQAKAEQEEQRRQTAVQQAVQDAAKNARIAGEVDKYKAMIINAISRQWILPENVNNGLSSQFRIRLAPDGAVLEVSLIRSSGDPILDRSAQTAIYKASPLPVPADPSAFDVFRDISLTVRPENVRG